MNTTDKKLSAHLPASAKAAEEWLVKGYYFNSGHQTQIEVFLSPTPFSFSRRFHFSFVCQVIAGKSLDQVLAERGLVKDDDPQPAVLTPEQKAAQDRICVVKARKKNTAAQKAATTKAVAKQVKRLGPPAALSVSSC